MAKCVKCKKRKGKRYCPALKGYLCNLCCGLLREKDIDCPEDCSFLEKHRPYQEKRSIEKEQALLRGISPEEDILKDERMAWLAFHIEAPLKEKGEKDKSFTDKDALKALEYTKEKIEKEKPILIAPDERSRAKNVVGEAVFQNIERCRYEGKIVLPGDAGGYKKEEKIKCLERVMLSVKFLAKGNTRGRKYIEQLIGRFSKIEDLSRQKKIIPVG